jgi:transcriptional regulator GlxA family with amidase domain
MLEFNGQFFVIFSFTPVGAFKSICRVDMRGGADLFDRLDLLGRFDMAACGLLDGKAVTSHWSHTDLLASRFPKITVNAGVLFVAGDGIYTSAGSAAGLGIGLHIILHDFGAQVAANVTRRLVVLAQRDGR